MKKLLTLLILPGALLGTGCMSFSDRHFEPVRESLSRQLPEITLEREIGLSFGGGLFNLVDLVSDEADFSAIDHLRVAVYKVHPAGSDRRFDDVVFGVSLLARDPGLTWERIVRVREEGEQVWVYAGMDLEADRLEALSVFVLERGELTLISVDGDLNGLLEYAMSPAQGRRGVYRAG